MKYSFVAILLLLVTSAFGQNIFNGILLSKQDSTAIPFAAIKLMETNDYTTTNDKGEFTFKWAADLHYIHFEIFAIGLRDTISLYVTHKAIEKIYVNKLPLSLNSVTIKGWTPEAVVRKAVASIPSNFTDSSFVSGSFYRQYEKVNGEFKNLIEAQTNVSFLLSVSDNTITSNYGFDIEQMRKSDFRYYIEDLKYEDLDYSDLLNQNPVYNLSESSLNPRAFPFYIFHFDTVAASGDYVINYSCPDFSSDDHGIGNFKEMNWHGESWEEGQLVIDPVSFAFKKIERSSFRNWGFHYSKNNNFVLPSRHYYEEFINGNLVIDYKEFNGKWFPVKICRNYTNAFFNSMTGKKDYVLTEVFEWYSEHFSHFINPELADKFFKDTPLNMLPYTYVKSEWDKALPPFYYFTREAVYQDLEKQSSIEEQFKTNGK